MQLFGNENAFALTRKQGGVRDLRDTIARPVEGRG